MGVVKGGGEGATTLKTLQEEDGAVLTQPLRGGSFLPGSLLVCFCSNSWLLPTCCLSLSHQATAAA